jgi:hypothetical protein
VYFFPLLCYNLRDSNEPCTDKSKHGRAELARKRQGFDLDVYGECRDSEQTPCVCEPVGMANCVPTESTDKATVRRVELARKRRFVDLDVYGECRDSEQKGKQKRFVR